MSTGKRLDLRFGAFACSVQGFDDPVPPVQQILRAIQHLLEESPELSDTAINFDAEAIEQLVGEVARRSELDESEVEIVPGLVIIHHGAGGDLAAGGDWAERERDDERGAEPERAPDEAGGDYVNIFAPAGGSEPAEEAAGEEEVESEEEDFADRLRRMAAGGDPYGWDEDQPEEAGERLETEEPGEADAAGGQAEEPEDEDDEEPLNLFAPVPPEGDARDGRETAEAGAGAGASVRSLFALGGQEDDRQPAQDSWRTGDAAAPGDAEEAPSGEDLDAAGFARRAGAVTVPELMVASAAWMVLVQGQTSFTRRDVLDVFETIPGEHENTPEARVKGFGKAVRNGQLVMTGDGIFGLARSEVERFQNLL